MTTYFIYTMLIAFVSAFIILLLKKLGIVESWQIHGNDFISKMASCDFCLSFWCNLFISLIWFMACTNPQLLISAFFGTPITRYFVSR